MYLLRTGNAIDNYKCISSCV